MTACHCTALRRPCWLSGNTLTCSVTSKFAQSDSVRLLVQQTLVKMVTCRASQHAEATTGLTCRSWVMEPTIIPAAGKEVVSDWGSTATRGGSIWQR